MLHKHLLLLEPEATPAAGVPPPAAAPVAIPSTARPEPEIDLFSKQVKEIHAAAMAGKDMPGTTSPPPPTPPPSQPAAAPAPAPTPEPPPEPYTPRKAADWKLVTGERDQYKAKVDELTKVLEASTKELESAKKTQAAPEEIQRLREENDKLVERLERVSLEQSPKFESHYSKLFGQAISTAKDTVSADLQDRVESLLLEKPSKQRKEKLNEIISGIESDIDRASFAMAIQQMDNARNEREGLLANARQTLSQLRDREQAEAKTKADLAAAAAQERTQKALERAQSFLAFRPIDGDDKHNTAIAKRQDKIRRAALGQLTADELADMAILAEEGRHIVENVLPPLVAELKARESTATSVAKAEPTPGGHGAPVPSNSSPPDFIKEVLKTMRS